MKHVVRAASARVATAAVALAVLSAWGPSAAAAPAPDPARPGPTQPDVRVERAGPLLAEPVGGAAAVRELGDRLPAAARVNDLSARRLETVLRTDDTARLSTDGRLHYVDPLPADLPEDPPSQVVLRGTAAAGDAFALHSNPGAARSIFLDFDGHAVVGTSWNTNYGVAAGEHPGWDPSGDGAGFNDSERAKVEQIWSMVSEDFAAYDVDVTTQDPGAAGLLRSDPLDQTYGVRALVSPSSNAWSSICDQQCGGVAFVGVYDRVGGSLQPAWVFPQGLGNSPKAVAEATTHEVGHNLALEHDGTSTAGYYPGHGSWAPIMGVGYDRPITQWSKGEYAGADNSQDDLATIAGYLARRADEPAGAAPRTGYITSDADSDVLVLGRCASGSQIRVDSPYVTPDLDVRARLLSPDGVVLATADPASGMVDETRAYGMDATLTIPADGRYLVEVSGASNGQQTGGSWSGYSAYGSIGAYQVAAGGCDRDVVGVPSSPTGLAESAPATTSTLSLRWAPPTDPGASPVTGYTVTPGTGDPVRLGPDARGVTLTGLAAATTYDVAVTAVNARGPGVAASLRLRTATPQVTVPSAPTSVSALWNADLARPEMYWQPPASDGGSPRTGYALTVDGHRLEQVGAAWTGVFLDGDFAPGEHTMTVAAVNAAGTGPAARAQFTVPGPPPATAPGAPTGVVATPGDSRAEVRWSAPTDTGGAPVTSYTVTGSPGGATTTVAGDARTATLAGLTNGTAHRFTVTATNAAGTSAASAVSAPVVPAAPPERMGSPGAAVRGTKVVVTWQPAAPQGSPVTAYTVLVSGERAKQAAASATRLVVRGVSRGRHTVRITATNALGTSPPSAATSIRVR